MNDSPRRQQPPVPAGLCATCRQAAEVATDRGSVFVRCSVSDTDARFARYPALPVLRCPGYERQDVG